MTKDQERALAAQRSKEMQEQVKRVNAAANLIGYMYISRRPCGRVSAMCWDDKGHEKSTAKHVAEQIRRGLTVERVARYEGDPQPETMCRECRGRPCTSTATPPPSDTAAETP